MRKIVLALSLAVAFTGATAAPALAAPEAPTTLCEVQEFLGFENVQDCDFS